MNTFDKVCAVIILAAFLYFGGHLLIWWLA
jgi:uncharacterized membrane protein